jgi:N-acetylglucosaminyldiphosphoundecaprenol N-acetyl-beta-D-mannosaminyltransferase
VHIQLLGIEIDALTAGELCMVVADSVKCGNQVVIANHNLHSLYLFHHDPVLREFYSRAHKIHIDGMSLIYLARIFGYTVRREQRATYLDWIWQLLAECSHHHWRVFYLGGKSDVAEKAASRIRQEYYGLQIGTHHGYFNSADVRENQYVLNAINYFQPDILMVGMGMPLQEQWILENLSQIQADVILTAGACFDYIAGSIPTPPRWMGQIGLEWLFRLLSEPKRLWGRYLVEPWFLVGLILKALYRKNRDVE